MYMARMQTSWGVVLLVLALACSPSDGGDVGAARAAGTPDVATAPVSVSDGEVADEEVLYGLGLIMAQGMTMLALSPSERKILEQALADYREGSVRVPLGSVLGRIEEFQKERLVVARELESAASEKFLEAALAEPGAVQAGSGAIYRSLVEGDSDEPSPTLLDAVEVEFEIRLRDGTVVDSSKSRGGAQTWSVRGTLPCWLQVLPQMKVGGKAKVTCPAESAFGDNGKLPLVLPAAAIESEIELVSIQKGQAMRHPAMYPELQMGQGRSFH